MNKIIVIGIAIAVALASFWAGTYYQSRQFMANRPFGMMGGYGQMQRSGQSGARRPGFGNRGPGDGPRGARIISGRLDRVDGDKLTLTTAFGSIKVTLAKSAKIKQADAAASTDLKVGKQLIIQGAAHQNGQLTAKSVIQE